MSRMLTASLTAWMVIAGSLQPALARAAEPTAVAPTAAAPAPTTEPTAAPSTTAPATTPPVVAPTPAPTTTTPGATWDDEPISPPPPVVTYQTAPPADLPPPAPRPPTRGKVLLGIGIGLLAVGGSSLLFVAAPSALVKRAALDRAERDDALGFSTRKQRYHRARIADDAMEAGFWVGISGLVLGTALAITGGVMKSRSRSAAMARIGGGPGGVAIRF